jgi:hypothetical protein
MDIGAERHLVAVQKNMARFSVDQPVRRRSVGYAPLVEVAGATRPHFGGDRSLLPQSVPSSDREKLPTGGVNPLRNARFAEDELRRTRTDATDAWGLQRFRSAKTPARSRVTRRRNGRAA